jgi:DUF4097 and DUF4098 domain-containing protein YvlB
VVFLLRNFGIGPNLWGMARRYWPILLILLGLGKVIDYLRRKEGVSVRFGEVFNLLFVVIIGLAISQIPDSAVKDLVSTSINIGGTDMFLGTSHEYSADATYPLPAGMPVRVENSNGQVSVAAGSDNEVRVHLRKRVYDDDESLARKIAEEIKVIGGQEGVPESLAFVLKTNREELSGRDYRFTTDMEVYVPKKSAVEVQNAFGGVTVAGLEGNLDLESSQRLLEVRDCIGTFRIANRYGESRLTNLTGNLTIDASGRVTAEGIKGDVDVRNERAQIVIRQVEGKVTVAGEEGSVTVERVSKPVVIDARGSQVTAEGLQDSLKITGSHRRIQVTDVAGGVTLISEYGRPALNKIKGNVDISSNSDQINLDDIGGSVKVKAQGSYLRVNMVGGPVEIETTRKEVNLNNLSQGCRVTNEFGDVTLSLVELGKDPISIKNRNGDITVFLPPTAAFQLDATARNGRVTSDFPGLELPAEAGDSAILKGKVKSGGPKILLETENNDIYVRTQEAERRARRER